ncbi:MAG TPA: NADH-quinone oxidoreductase subunit B [Cyanobacteria bacterium UBA8803]|nr:NADH-quinone oxidoreductase subunit B [Cyanobacteria bacterium UBA9273]HBL62799.1 NADH-quinone oxidoreductase subunit B [Cyanobacteria bacterium UBA8803]
MTNYNPVNPDAPFDNQQIISPAGPYSVTQQLSENIILTTVDDLYNWARLSSLWPLLYGTACCFIEFAAMIGSRFDFDRFGLIPRASPRQADLIILAGTLNMKMAQPTLRLYEQMPEPKYVIAMGACMISGGMFSADSYTALRGADKILPIDVYIPGCPPRPEAIMDAIIKLRKKISNQSLQERGKFQRTNRYYSTTHNMKPVPPTTVTGRDVTLPSRQQPPKEFTEAMGMLIPPALKRDQKEEYRN